MKIQVLNFYSKRGGINIEAGVYEAGNPVLHGLAEYLVANGHAIQLTDEKPEPKKVAK